MLLQGRELCKAHLASRALKWLFSSVRPHVLLQSLTAAESFKAARLVALKLLLFAVHALYVLHLIGCRLPLYSFVSIEL